MTRDIVFRVLHGFCGSGGGALGFAQAEVVLAGLGLRARFECAGGVDFDPNACRDFEMLTGGKALCADVLTLTTEQLRALAGDAAPDVVFGSAPCKGSSGLLSAKLADSPKYRAMNELALAWTRLLLSTWTDRPKLLIFENVPRIVTRAKTMLTKLRSMLRAAGYVLHESSHDCGELGGLAQHRRRWLLVARHADTVPSLLYKPPSRRVRGVGEVLGEMPMPEEAAGGRMHRLPRLSWTNWIRLALIPAGGDWRDLAGVLAEGQARREQFRRHHVERWEDPSVTVAGVGSNGPSAIADPRAKWYAGILGVTPWADPSCTITGRGDAACGAFSTADPRTDELLVPHAYPHGYGVLRWEQSAWVIAAGSMVGQGGYSVGDPRLSCKPRSGAYGVLAWLDASGTVTGSADVDNSAVSVADPRPATSAESEVLDLKKAPKQPPVIIAEDGTWHRPLTTLELAAIQGFPWRHNGAPLQFTASSSAGWRQGIGNAVPPPTARAIAERMLATLAHAQAGAFSLSSDPVWVAPESDDAPMVLMQ